MPNADHNLAIEMSGRRGTVTLGRNDDLLGTTTLPDRRRGRHDVALMPAIDALFKQHGVQPRDLGELYVSIGPGSFTGLRIAVATAKSMAQVLKLRVVAVPTIDALAQNAPAPDDRPNAPQRLLACLALKSGTAYAGAFVHRDGAWAPSSPPGLVNLKEQLGQLAGPTLILGDDAIHAELQRLAADNTPGTTLLPPRLAETRSDAVWRLGRERAARAAFDDPWRLRPLYARPPEAEVLWNQRYPTSSSSAGPTSASPAC